jgi:hypothetical protein
VPHAQTGPVPQRVALPRRDRDDVATLLLAVHPPRRSARA